MFGIAGVKLKCSPSVSFPALLQGLKKFYHFHFGNWLTVVFADFFAKTHVEVFTPPATAVEKHEAGGLTCFLF